MADVSKVTTPNGNEYDIKDVKARGVDLTSAEYWALVNADEDDPDTNYHLTDAPSVNITPELISNIASILYPVGSIYMSTSNVNPETYILNTTWEAWGSGRVPVGVSTDAEFNTVEKTGGEKTHTLSVKEIPSHDHQVRAYNSNNTSYTMRGPGLKFTNVNGSMVWTNPPTTTAGGTGGDPCGYSDATGGSQAHNNLQPYITCYMWKRTA